MVTYMLRACLDSIRMASVWTVTESMGGDVSCWCLWRLHCIMKPVDSCIMFWTHCTEPSPSWAHVVYKSVRESTWDPWPMDAAPYHVTWRKMLEKNHFQGMDLSSMIDKVYCILCRWRVRNETVRGCSSLLFQDSTWCQYCAILVWILGLIWEIPFQEVSEKGFHWNVHGSLNVKSHGRMLSLCLCMYLSGLRTSERIPY